MLLAYIAYQVLIAILGGTWTTENIIIAGMGIILAGMFAIVGFLICQELYLRKLPTLVREKANTILEHAQEPNTPRNLFQGS